MKFRLFTCILCVIMAMSVLHGCSSEDENSAEKMADLTTGDTKTMTDLVEEVVATPDETGAKLGKIPGFTQRNSVSTRTLPHAVGEGALTVVAVGEYTGAYIEDGTDAAVDKVAAAVVQNTGNKPIQHATLTLGAGEEKLYTFSLSTLPAGCSVLVLEAEKKIFSEEKEISAFSADVIKCDELEMNADKIRVTFEDGVLKLKNLTNSNFRGVYVRYKNFTAGNVYYGGITYSATFDNVSSKGIYEYKAAHYHKDLSKIMMVQIVE